MNHGYILLALLVLCTLLSVPLLYLRRNAAGDVVVVPIENWKNSSSQCGGVN